MRFCRTVINIIPIMHIFLISKGGAVMKKNEVIKRELKCTYGIDIALCVFSFLICSVLCAGGSEWLNIAGVIAFVTAILPIGFRRIYYKDEITSGAVDAVMAAYRIILTALILYGIDYFLIAGV